ncbi:ribonuclease H-like domain-containing protein [Paenibacillus cremeus]|uniref:YprB ribonuclease H-like domain-containing protein n=1 Tax=Paenibacillus cremeus TaxID=2163881 RepID=A0A559KDA0_9BACL|nr:ribonuclease H-like domain-containing protein [Paenibacillus cremeus]TVY10126.1 hypothetical protein FPZ49_10450 [Paenibacillus cremeus]
MSSLRERLLRHKKPSSVGSSIQEPDDAARYDRLDEAETKAAQERADCNEWQAIEGMMESNEWGSFVLRRRTYTPGFRHGKYVLSELEGEGEPLRLLLAKSSELSVAIEGTPLHEQLLFIDTETTGLGLGAGNVPFMVGIGFYNGGVFTVEQMLIRHPGEEIAMLAHLQMKLRERPILISYNGKSFDWPIVKGRYIMNRLPLEVEPEGHIDFLYPSRSLWRHTLPSCRLGKVEEERLEVHREDDVPGSMAPALYFQYLAEKDPSVLKGVFLHNELDILSLAGLAVHFAGVLAGRISWRQTRVYGLEEWFRLGLWLDRLGLSPAANETMDALSETLLLEEDDSLEVHDLEAEDGSSHWLPLAQYYKQQQRYDQACALWKRYIALKGTRSTASLEPYIELSMYYEHKEKQWETALQYAELALDKVWQRGALMRSGKGRAAPSGKTTKRARGSGKSDPVDKEALELEKRIERLRRKTANRSTPAASVRKPRAPKPLGVEAQSSRGTKLQAEQLSLLIEHSV